MNDFLISNITVSCITSHITTTMKLPPADSLYIPDRTVLADGKRAGWCDIESEALDNYDAALSITIMSRSWTMNDDQRHQHTRSMANRIVRALRLLDSFEQAGINFELTEPTTTTTENN